MGRGQKQAHKFSQSLRGNSVIVMIAVSYSLLTLMIFLLRTLSHWYHDALQIVRDDSAYKDFNSWKNCDSPFYDSTEKW